MRKMVTITMALGLSLVLLSLGMPQLAGAAKGFCGDGKCHPSEREGNENECTEEIVGPELADCPSGSVDEGPGKPGADPSGGQDAICEGTTKSVLTEMTFAATPTIDAFGDVAFEAGGPLGESGDCGDGVDNDDGDGLADLLDPDCQTGLLSDMLPPDDPYTHNRRDNLTAIIGSGFDVILEPNTSNKEENGRTVFVDLRDLGCGGDVDENRDGTCDDCFASGLDVTDPFEPVRAEFRAFGKHLDDMEIGVYDTGAVLIFEAPHSPVIPDCKGCDSGIARFFLFWDPFANALGTKKCPSSPGVKVERTRDTVTDEPNIWTVRTTGNHLACLYSGDEANAGPPLVYHGQAIVPVDLTAVGFENFEEPAVPEMGSCFPLARADLPVFDCE